VKRRARSFMPADGTNRDALPKRKIRSMSGFSGCLQ